MFMAEFLVSLTRKKLVKHFYAIFFTHNDVSTLGEGSSKRILFSFIVSFCSLSNLLLEHVNNIFMCNTCVVNKPY